MQKRLQVKLVSYNINNTEICASAARISTTQGNAVEIFEKAMHNNKNQELVKKVLQSGHKSVIEHAMFNFALKDVSAFAEQFFIEYRLASFTVKSRRYVDFSKLGYYIPSDLEGENLNQYCTYMNELFSVYQIMLENGVPKEDARFLLPYSFNSNFYCTLNARELIHIICDIKYGRGQGIRELQDIANQMIEQVELVFPYIRQEVSNVSNENKTKKNEVTAVKVKDTISLIEPQNIGKVSLLNKPLNPAEILNKAYSISHPDAENSSQELDMLFKTERPRELEQLSYSFLISDITLSGITHIVRHRMQSIIIPSIKDIDHSKFIIPETVIKNSHLSNIYKNAMETANNMLKEMSTNETLRQYSYYYALSGNVMNIMTTMNARELKHFIKLRACNRAQWEIRNISIEMLIHLRDSFPELFDYFGPSCYIVGKCPEGNMTCGKMTEVIANFSGSKNGDR